MLLKPKHQQGLRLPPTTEPYRRRCRSPDRALRLCLPHALNQRQAQQEWNAQARVAANISRAQFREVRVDFLLYWILNAHWRKN